jgi:hypothetical protein
MSGKIDKKRIDKKRYGPYGGNVAQAKLMQNGVNRWLGKNSKKSSTSPRKSLPNFIKVKSRKWHIKSLGNGIKHVYKNNNRKRIASQSRKTRGLHKSMR